MNQAQTPIDRRMLAAALDLPDFDARAAQRIMEPAHRGRPSGSAAAVASARSAAALAFVFDAQGTARMPLTLCDPSLREHRGQVSLPGGHPAAGESLWDTALREAAEEIALATVGVERLGPLAPVYIPVTHTWLHVHVAWGPAPTSLTPNPGEVERIEVVDVAHLLDDARRGRRVLRIKERDIDVPYFDIADLFVWGATAMALSELAERLRVVRAGGGA